MSRTCTERIFLFVQGKVVCSCIRTDAGNHKENI